LSKEEAELIARCKKGDIKSYELLYCRYRLAMYHTCLRIVINIADAEDILQDAFMDAFTNLDKIKNMEAFAGWLKRIVINKSINFIKRHKRNWLELEAADTDEIEVSETFDELEFSTKIEAVTKALNMLNDKYRAVINLHVFEQMSFEDIAALMEIPSATVRSQYLRGKQKVLTIIGHKI
jgi:RNA polymerase sigma-70 factor (ECF subfamily)